MTRVSPRPSTWTVSENRARCRRQQWRLETEGSPDGAYDLSVASTPAASGLIVKTRRRRMSVREAADHVWTRKQVSFLSPGWEAGLFLCALKLRVGVGPEPFPLGPRLNSRTPFCTPK